MRVTYVRLARDPAGVAADVRALLAGAAPSVAATSR
jgi:hypothetical protein